jgi:hypothetical protein
VVNIQYFQILISSSWVKGHVDGLSSFGLWTEASIQGRVQKTSIPIGDLIRELFSKQFNASMLISESHHFDLKAVNPRSITKLELYGYSHLYTSHHFSLMLNIPISHKFIYFSTNAMKYA